jgi:hypothetical protein
MLPDARQIEYIGEENARATARAWNRSRIDLAEKPAELALESEKPFL